MEPLSILSNINTILSFVNGGFSLAKNLNPDNTAQLYLSKLEKIQTDIAELKDGLEALNIKIDLNQLAAETGQAEASINTWYNLSVAPWLQGNGPDPKTADGYIAGSVGAEINAKCIDHLQKINEAICGELTDNHFVWLDLIIKQMMEAPLAGRDSYPTSVCEMAYQYMLYLYNLQLRGIICLYAAKNDGLHGYAHEMLTDWFPRQAEKYQEIIGKWSKDENFVWIQTNSNTVDNGRYLTITDSDTGHLRNFCMLPTKLPDGKVTTGACISMEIWQTGIALSYDDFKHADPPTTYVPLNPSFGANVDVLTDGGDGFHDPEVHFDLHRFEADGENVISSVQIWCIFTQLFGGEEYNLGVGGYFKKNDDRKRSYFTLSVDQVTPQADGTVTAAGTLRGEPWYKEKGQAYYDARYFTTRYVDTSCIGGIARTDSGFVSVKGGLPVNGIAFRPMGNRGGIMLKNSLRLHSFGIGGHVKIGADHYLRSEFYSSYITNHGEHEPCTLDATGSPFRTLYSYGSIDFSKWTIADNFKDNLGDGKDLLFHDWVKLRVHTFRSGDHGPLFLSTLNYTDTGTASNSGMTDFIVINPDDPTSKAPVMMGHPCILARIWEYPQGKFFAYPLRANGDVYVAYYKEVTFDPKNISADVIKKIAADKRYLWQFR